MGSGSLYLKAERYCATAERMRRLALRLQFSEARRELPGLASRFYCLAARATDAASPGPASADAKNRCDSDAAA